MLKLNSFAIAKRRVTSENSISSCGSSLLIRDRMAKCSTKSSTDDGSRSKALSASFKQVKQINEIYQKIFFINFLNKRL